MWRKRNELASQADGGGLETARQMVVGEMERGAERNSGVEELLRDGARPVDNLILGYIQMWLTSV